MRQLAPRPYRPVSAFLFGAALGLLGEGCLLMRAHCRQLEAYLLDDFRVVAFLRDALEESRLRVVEERLRAVDGVEALRYVSPAESLREIQREDPEMSRAVALLGDNPLPGAFEVQVAAGQVARMPEWQRAIEAVPELGEVRYKPMEARAILQVQFYARFLTLTLSLAAFLCLSMAAWTAWAVFVAGEGVRGSARSRAWAARAAWTGAGSALGMSTAALFALPAASSELLHAWPRPLAQALLALAAAAGGWALTAPATGSRRELGRRSSGDGSALGSEAAQFSLP